MITYEGFKERHYPRQKQWGQFPEEQLNALRNALPVDVIEFLQKEGVSSYVDGFLWTTIPADFHDILNQWGLKGDQCYVFMRSAFGACVYYHKEEYFYLDPIEGRIVSLGDDFYLLLNYMLTLDAILESGFFIDYYLNMEVDRNLLQPDELFSFAPPFPLGGSFEISKIEIVKIKEHLLYLAKLFKNKATKI